MARKNAKEETKLNYGAEVRSLKECGPATLYLLWGPEDYLREQFLNELRKACLPEGEDSFSCKRLNGPDLDPLELQQAIDAVPFLTERSFVEIRDADLNRLKEPEKVLAALQDIPDYCTVAFVQNAQYEPDGRLKLIKGIRSAGRDMKFTQAPQGQLIEWIRRRFAAHDKGIELEAVQRLILISGDLMNRLIPEIDKISAYAKGDRVTVSDVEAVASHVPEAVVFEMTDRIAEKKAGAALSVLAELLADKNNEPIPILAMLSVQMRRLFAARLAVERGLGVKYVTETCAIKYDFAASKLMQSARGYTLPQLRRAVEICAETDYKIKSSSQDDRELLIEAVLRIAAGEEHA